MASAMRLARSWRPASSCVTAGSVLRVAGTVTGLAGGDFRDRRADGPQAAQAAIVPAGQTLANGQRVAVWTDQALVSGELVARVIRIGGLALPAQRHADD